MKSKKPECLIDLRTSLSIKTVEEITLGKIFSLT